MFSRPAVKIQYTLQGSRFRSGGDRKERVAKEFKRRDKRVGLWIRRERGLDLWKGCTSESFVLNIRITNLERMNTINGNSDHTQVLKRI